MRFWENRITRSQSRRLQGLWAFHLFFIDSSGKQQCLEAQLQRELAGAVAAERIQRV